MLSILGYWLGIRSTLVEVLQRKGSDGTLSKIFDLALNLAVHFGQATFFQFSLCIKKLFKLVPEC